MLRLDPGACLLGAMLLLVLPLPWLLAAATAAAFHELCHLGAVRVLGGQVRSLTVGPGGAVMEARLDGPWRATLAAMAGPAGSLLLLSLLRPAPRLALCGLIQGLFNLLPLYPLDGGRMLRLWLPARVSRVTEAAAGCLVCLLLLRLHPVLGVLLALRLIFRNIPCKREKSEYNRE